MSSCSFIPIPICSFIAFNHSYDGGRNHYPLEIKSLELTMTQLHFRCVTIISDMLKALSGSADATFRVWDLNSSAYLKQDRLRSHLTDVTDIAVTRDGSRCVSASRDGSLKIWNCETAEECFTSTGKVRSVHLRHYIFL